MVHSAPHSSLSRLIITSWILLNLITSSVGLVFAEEQGQQTTILAQELAETGSWGKITPTRSLLSGKPQPEHVEEKTPLRGAVLSLPIAQEPSLAPLSPLQLADGMPSRLQPVLFLFFLFSMGALIGTFSRKFAVITLAAAAFMLIFIAADVTAIGCCTHPIPGNNIFVCLNTDFAACCGSDDGSTAYRTCNVSFVQDNVDCFDPSTPVPECLNSFGCCVYDQGCADTQYEAQCVGGVYKAGESCDNRPECRDTCCVWTDNTDNFCSFVPDNTCDVLNETSGFPSEYRSSYHLGGKNASVPNSRECQQDCGSYAVGPANISGFVDDSGGVPLLNVTVSNGYQSTLTDASGQYFIYNSYSGGVFLELTKPGFYPIIDSFTLLPNTAVERNYTMSFSGYGTVNGHVLIDLGGGSIPVEGATVVLKGENGWAYQDTVVATDAFGFFEFPQVIAGHDYSLTGYMLNNDFYEPASSGIFPLGQGDLYSTDLLLTYNGPVNSISGSVVDLFFAPYPSRVFTISVVRLEGGAWTELTTDTGNFSITNLTQGTYQLQAIDLLENESSSISVSVIDTGDVTGEILMVVDTGTGNATFNCSDIVPAAVCCLDFTCPEGSSLGFTNDCGNTQGQVCCVESCMQDLRDTDGDGTPDIYEPACRFEPEITSDTAKLPSEVGRCDNNIDDDCDSTAYTGPGEPDTNREDETDPDCRICPVTECQFTNNTWCNETASQLSGIQVWQEYNLSIPLENITYCGDGTQNNPGLCSGDEECVPANDCAAGGGVCCNYECNGTEFSSLNYACSGGVCCSDNFVPACNEPGQNQFDCAPYDWLCQDGYYFALPNTICVDPEPYACALPPTRDVPTCELYEEIASPLNIWPNKQFWRPENLEPGGTPVPANATVCTCSAVEYNTSADGQTPSDGYCCLGAVSDYWSPDPCPVLPEGNYKITVYDVNTTVTGCTYRNPLCPYYIEGFSYVRFFQSGLEVDLHDCTSVPYPQCQGQMPVGLYNVSIHAPDRTPDNWEKNPVELQNFNIISPGLTTAFAWLEMGADCAADPPPAMSNFRLENIMGTTDFTLIWQSNCSGYNLHVYWGPEGSITYDTWVLEGQYSCTGSLCSWNHTAAPPNDWDTVYEYKLEAIYPGNRISDNATALKSTGDQLCEGRIDSAHEFCMNEERTNFTAPLTQQMHCTSDNILEGAPMDETIPVGNVEGDCTTEEGDPRNLSDQLCIGPDTEQLVKCIDPDNCKVLGASGGQQGPYSLGVFFNESACYTTWDDGLPFDNYCYWEYSDTVVDQCTNCSQDLTCYGYISEEACAVDWCEAQGNPAEYIMPNGTCEWMPTWEEFGKGICYRPDFPGDEYCSLCNLTSDLFLNPQCTQNVCTNLGFCYSNGEECKSCNGENGEPLKCEDYVEQESCTGGNDQSFVQSSFTCPRTDPTLSNDTCGVGVCHWNGSRCFKDINNNDIPDCFISPEGELPTGTSGQQALRCREDHAPPTTITSILPNKIGQENVEINFTVTDDNFFTDYGKSMVYWSLNNLTCSDTSCNTATCSPEGCGCPIFFNATMRSINDDEMYIMLPEDWDALGSEPPVRIPQGTVALEYYAEDRWGYPELISTRYVEIDTIPPRIENVSIWSINSTSSNYTSDLYVSFDTSEPADCGASFINVNYATPGIEETTFELSHVGHWDSIYDGIVLINLTCEDDFGNVNSSFHTHNLTRMGIIFDLHPDPDLGDWAVREDERLNNIFTNYIVDFEGTTPTNKSDLQCNLYEGISSMQMWVLMELLEPDIAQVLSNLSNIVTPVPMSNTWVAEGLYHFVSVAMPVDENFLYGMFCYNLTTGNVMAAEFYFAQDAEGPDTTLEYENTQLSLWLPYEGTRYERTVNLRFSCSDPDYPQYGGAPGEATCNQTFYCQSDGVCAPDTEKENLESFTVNTQDQWVCWTSYDKKGNQQSPPTLCKEIRIDTESPTINITYPPMNWPTASDQIFVNGTWDDNHWLDRLRFERDSLIISGGYIGPNTFSSGNSTTPMPLDLVQGENILTAFGTDEAMNPPAEDTVTIYYDLVPPIGSLITPALPVEYGWFIDMHFHADDQQYTALYEQQNEIEFVVLYNNTPVDPMYNPFTIQLAINETYATHNITPYIDESGDYNIKPGNYTVRYLSRDSLGNTGLWAEETFEVQDSHGPVLNITITNTHLSHPGWLIDMNQTYYAEIVSSEPLLNDYLNISYSWTSPRCADPVRYFENVQMVDPTHFTAEFFLPDPTVYNCLEDVEDLIDFDTFMVFDRNMQPVVDIGTADNYSIDTLSAGTVQFFYPRDNLETGYISNTSNAGYLVGYSDTGHTPYSMIDVYLVKRDTPIPPNELPIFTGWNRSLNTLSAEPETDLGIIAEVSIYNRTEGDSWLLIDHTELMAGQGIAFDGHPRITEDFYLINSSIWALAHRNITVIPVLEENISIGTSVTVYAQTEPGGWFNASFDLDLGEGRYFFYGYGTDDHGIRSKEPGWVSVIYDASAPVIDTLIPANGLITSEQELNISAHATDAISGLNPTKTRLTIISSNPTPHNGTYTCADSQILCVDADNNPVANGTGEMTVVYVGSTYDYSDYDLELYVEDLAGTGSYATWTFEVRDSVPGDPTMTMDSGFTFPDAASNQVWYVPLASGFLGNLTFENDSLVNITQLDQLLAGDPDPPYSRLSNNSFLVDFNQPLDELDYPHMLAVYATKKVNLTDWSPPALISVELMTIDLTDPLAAIDNLHTTGNGTFLAVNTYTPVLGGNFTDTNLDGSENGLYPNANRIWVVYTDQFPTPNTTRTSDASISSGTWSADLTFFEFPIEKTLDITLNVCDKSGRCIFEDTILIYDTIGPPAVVLSASVPTVPAWVTDSSVTFNWTIPTDYSGIESFLLYQDGGTSPFLTVDGNVTSYVWDNIATGVHSFSVRPMDFAGNPGFTATFDFQVDSSPPTIGGITVEPDRTRDTFRVTATITDDGQGIIQDAIVLVNGTGGYCTLTSISGETYIFDCDISSMADVDASLPLNITAQDPNGGVGYGTASIHVDTRPPVILTIDNVAYTSSNSEPIDITTDENAICRWSAESNRTFATMLDFDSGDNSTSHSVEVPLNSDGTHTFYLKCQDDLTNTMPGLNSTSIVRDTTPPSLFNIGFGEIVYTKPSPLTYYTIGSTLWVWGDAEQLTTINVTVGTESRASIYIDDTMSPVLILDADGFSENNLTVPVGTQVQFTNNIGGALIAELTSDVPGMLAVNISDSDSYNHTMDTIGDYLVDLKVTTTTGNNTTTYDLGTLPLTVRDISDSFNLSITLDEGSDLMHVIATDDLGNPSSSQFYMISYDYADPAITNINPGDGTSTNDFRSTVEFDINDVGSGVDWNALDMNLTLITTNMTYECSTSGGGCTLGGILDTTGAPHVTFTGPSGWLNTSTMYYSLVDVSVSVFDLAGRNSSTAWTFTLDNDTPDTPLFEVAGLTCAGCSIYVPTPDPQIRIEFNLPVEILLAELNGNNVISSLVSNGDTVFTLDTVASSGSFTFEISAIKIDGGGTQVGRAGTWSQDYIIDSNDPSNVEISSVTNINANTVIVGSRPNWTTTDTELQLTINWNEANPDTLDITGVSPAISIPITGNNVILDVNITGSDGAKEITATVTDQGGHSASDTVTVNLDTTPPGKPVICNPGYFITHKEQVPLMGQASLDTVSLTVRVANFTNQTALIEINQSSITSREAFVGDYDLYLPPAGDNTLILDMLSSNCPDLVGNWLQFNPSSSECSADRYHIENCSAAFGTESIITLDRDTDSSAGSPIYVFSTEYSDGYFFVDVQLSQGDNVITATAFDEMSNWIESEPLWLQRNDSLSLTVTFQEPSDYVINQADFGAGSYMVSVSTDHAATCVLEHPEDIIARAFTLQMNGAGTTSHSYTFDLASCTENGGNYCMIGGDFSVQRYYERLTVRCTSNEYDLDPVSITPCLTIATYTSTQGNELGVNICQDSTGCGTDNTPLTSCRDCDNFNGDPNACEANVCFWCDTDSSCVSSCTSVSCPPEPNNYGGDLICDASCDSYGDQNSCTTTGFCSWCGDVGGSCMDSCSTCSDPYDYTGDGICDADCGTYNDTASCSATGFCNWCPSSNTCGLGCATCPGFPVSYGGDQICDEACDTYNGDGTSCLGTNYCLWCENDQTCGSTCSSCSTNPNNFGDDFMCDLPCNDGAFATENTCTNTQYCMWCPSFGSCGDVCNSCLNYEFNYYNDYVCDQLGSGNNWGWLT